MEVNPGFVCKNVYKEKLIAALNRIVLSTFKGQCGDVKLTVIESDPRETVDYNFMIPADLYRKWKTSFQPVCPDDAEIKECLDELLTMTKSWDIPFADVNVESDTIYFKVDCNALTSTLLYWYASETCSSVFRTKFKSSDELKSVLIFCYLSNSPSLIRTLVIASLLHQKNAKLVQLCKSPLQSNVNAIIGKLRLSLQFEPQVESVEEVMQTLKSCEYYFTASEGTDYQYYILFHNKLLTKFGIKSKDLLNTKLVLTPYILSCIANIEQAITTTDMYCYRICHIGPQDLSRTSHQLCILLLLYLDLKSSNHILIAKKMLDESLRMFHGPVEGNVQPCDILETYTSCISKSFYSKYGESRRWRSLEEKLSSSVLKLDLLSVSLSSLVKRRLLSDGGSSSSKFIMYNYSRISTLLKNHASDVAKGFYPPLPNIRVVDLSLLKADCELTLLGEVWRFGDLRQLWFDELELDLKKWKPNLLVSYINRLCRSFSTYYNRHHILGSNLPHLLPLMHARLYLIKTIQKLLLEFFDIFRIIPLDEM